MMISYSRPFEEKFSNYWAMINELMVSFYLYVLMALFMIGQGDKSEELREIIGWILIAIVLASVGLNFMNFLWSVLKMSRLQFLIWYYTKCRKVKKEDVPPVFVDS